MNITDRIISGKYSAKNTVKLSFSKFSYKRIKFALPIKVFTKSYNNKIITVVIADLEKCKTSIDKP